MKYSEKFKQILQVIDKYKIKDSIENTLLSWENLDYDFDVISIDITGDPNTVEYKNKSGKTNRMKIGRMVKHLFGNEIKDRALTEFVEEYKITHEQIISGTTLEESSVKGFDKWTPLSGNHDEWIKNTFISMVTETYPHGHEKETLKYLPPLEMDTYGNYYRIIGENPTTMFTSHLDTASYEKAKVNLRLGVEAGHDMIFTDGKTILGSDDKTGVTIMLYMMERNVPGLYYYFIGEERGCIGSSKVARAFSSITYLANIKKVVSFDRRNYHSIITHQGGRKCCSDEFAQDLASKLNANGMEMKLDPTGVYTDSAEFIPVVPECTNISVGYFNEHTGRERQSFTHLIALCKASVAINWNDLVVARKIGIDPSSSKKYNKLLEDLKTIRFANRFTVETDEEDHNYNMWNDHDYGYVGGRTGRYGRYGYDEDKKVTLNLQMDDISLEAAHHDILVLNTTLKKHNTNYSIIIRKSTLKITLK
jgi:hypothetical protein